MRGVQGTREGHGVPQHEVQPGLGTVSLQEGARVDDGVMLTGPPPFGSAPALRWAPHQALCSRLPALSVLPTWKGSLPQPHQKHFICALSGTEVRNGVSWVPLSAFVSDSLGVRVALWS